MCSHGGDWTLSVDQCWLQALESSLHLIDLLSILLRHTSSESCRGSVRAADHQTFTMTGFSCKGGFGKCFGASPQSIHWAGLQQLIFLKMYILNNFIEIFYKSIWAKCMLYHTHTLSPTDYHLFKHLDDFLQGKCFHNQQDAKKSVQEFVISWIYVTVALPEERSYIFFFLLF